MSLNTVEPPETAAPASSSFYITGGTLPPEASSYVTRQADEDLFNGLLAGEYCYVLNSRQMGKSSLRVRAIGADLLTLKGDTNKGGINCVTSAEFSLDGKRVVTSDYNGIAKVWYADDTRLAPPY